MLFLLLNSHFTLRSVFFILSVFIVKKIGKSRLSKCYTCLSPYVFCTAPLFFLKQNAFVLYPFLSLFLLIVLTFFNREDINEGYSLIVDSYFFTKKVSFLPSVHACPPPPTKFTLLSQQPILIVLEYKISMHVLCTRPSFQISNGILHY